MTMVNDQTDGQDPPYGASINYWLASELEDEKAVEIRIESETGEVIRTLEGTQHAGINRIWWDLRGEPSDEIKMRTKPLYADWVDLGEERWRSAGGRLSVLMPPGTYNVVLKVGEVEQTQKLLVLKDPHSEGTEEDIRLQTEMLFDLRADMNASAKSINQIEWIRRQLYDMKEVAEDLDDAAQIISAADELDGTLIGIEEKLVQLKLTGTGQDGVRWPAMVMRRLSYLARVVAIADFRPTDQHREVHQVLKGRLGQAQQELDELLQTVLPEFNRTLEERDLPRVVTPGRP
jgi:hypothetical protein